MTVTDAPVLRQSPFGDVEARHDLQAGRDLLRELHRRRGDLLQHAVDAVADAVDLLVGLEVDVRRAAADRIQHDLVDELDDRRVVDVAGVVLEGGVAAGFAGGGWHPNQKAAGEALVWGFRALQQENR